MKIVLDIILRWNTRKLQNLLGNILDKVPTFIIKKWVEVHDQSGEVYNVNKQVRFKTPMLQSDLYDYSDAYIVLKTTITFADPDDANYNKKLVFKDNFPFISCISKN